MSMHMGKNRNLHTVNYEKDIRLQFNLAPLHILKIYFIPDLVRQLVEDERKQYFTTLHHSMLKFSSLLSSIGNFQAEQERVSHMPLSVVKNWFKIFSVTEIYICMLTIDKLPLGVLFQYDAKMHRPRPGKLKISAHNKARNFNSAWIILEPKQIIYQWKN